MESSANIVKVEDEAAIYANEWACMYRQMNPNQQLYAKRAIEKMLMLGRLNQLTYSTLKSWFNGFSTPYSTPVIFSDDSVQYIQMSVLPSGMQTYADIVAGPNPAKRSESYEDFT